MHKIKLLLIGLLAFISNCKGQTQQEKIEEYKTKIVGTWVSDDDSDYKIKFSTDGIQKEYIDNQIQSESYNFSIVSSCDENSNNGFDIYLKREYSGDITCDVLNNIILNDNGKLTLSITTQRGKLHTYTKL